MIRDELRQIAPDYHGAIDYAEVARYGLSADDILDFSVNSNPFGQPQAVRDAIAAVPLDRYPDKMCIALRSALSGHLGVDMGQLIVGNGAAELLWLIAFAMIRPGDSVCIIAPTFGEYARNARLMGAEIITWTAQPENNFAIDLDAIEQMLIVNRPRICHLCNPNNPTGQLVSDDVVMRWATTFPETCFVIDEAYIAFVTGKSHRLDSPDLAPNLIRLRSMTKDYALAGIRLGYAIADEAMIAGLRGVRIPWSVNGLAQAAGISALNAQPLYDNMLTQLHVETEALRVGLCDLGLRPHPSNTHYFLVDVGDGRAFREQLLRQAILVRLCESYQLPRHVRIAGRTAADNEHLLYAIKTGA